MEQWYKTADVAGIMGCSYDTARARMQEMPGVINVGSQKRRQLMVPETDLEDWFRNHRVITRVEIQLPKKVRLISKEGKMARIDRRTGKLKAV